MGHMRTYHPWGHVSKANRVARLNDEGLQIAHFKILGVENGDALLNELKAIHKKAEYQGVSALSEEEKMRYNAICDELVAKGVREDQIERLL